MSAARTLDISKDASRAVPLIVSTRRGRRFEEAPQDHVRLHELAQVLNRRAVADVGFRSDLEALIIQARAEGVDI